MDILVIYLWRQNISYKRRFQKYWNVLIFSLKRKIFMTTLQRFVKK